MSEQSKKVALPAYLPRQLEAFRIVQGDKRSYVLRDRRLGKTHDLEPWQFFVLEVLPGCEEIGKLLSVFSDRFGQSITEIEVMTFFGWLADNKLLDTDAGKHPLLKPFTLKGYVMANGLIKPKSFEELAAVMEHQGAREEEPAAQDPGQPDLLAGVKDADNLDPRRGRRVLQLFQLKGLLKIVLPVLSPLKWGVYALPFVAVAALFLVMQFWHLVVVDLGALTETTTLLTHVVFSFFTVNLVITMTQAMVAYHYRATVGHLGIALFLGFLPRLVVRISHTQQLSRRERMWLHAGPLLMRVLLFSIGVLLWYNLRDDRSLLARGGLALAFVSAVNLLAFSGNPFVRGNMYHLLAAFMNEPNLRGRSYRALMNKLRGGNSTEAGNNLLAGYGLSSLIYACLISLIATVLVLHYLGTTQIGGAAVIIAVALAIYLTTKTVTRFRRIGEAYERTVQFERWRKRALPAEAGETVQVEPADSRAAIYVRRVLGLTLLLLLFLPYPYEPGGQFVIYPSARQVLTTDVGGVIEEVNFDGGESVRKGTVIARIASTDLKAQFKIDTARIAEQRAIIKDLKSLPRPEAVAVAESTLKVAQEREHFSRDRASRQEGLYRDRGISFEELDAARKEHAVDIREVARAEAALALAKVGATLDQIDAELAKLDSLIAERNLVEGKISRTVIVMPFDGNILTLHLKERLNSVLDKGQPFATVEATHSVTAEIEVPESELGYVKVGAPVRLRPNAYFEKVFGGKVATIDRNVTAKSFGKVVKVIAALDNATGELVTGMSGYGKLEGPTMPVWKAFSLSLQRFVNVQIWSWIP